MSRTDEHGEEERRQRSEERDAVWMLAQQFLGYLYQPVHASRCLHDACTGHGGNDDVDDISWRRARLQTESENEQCQSNAGDST